MKRLMTLLLCLSLAACNLPGTPSQPPAVTPLTAAPSATEGPTATAQPSATSTDAPTSTPSPVPSETPTETPTAVPTEAPTSLPACQLLRGVTLPEKTACKDGPGAMYLFVYGLNQGATQDLIGRDDLGTWLLTRSHGDNVSCWVRTDFLKPSADPLCLPVINPDDFGLPRSPYYRPPTGVNASRSGDVVTVSWDAVTLRAGDDSLQTPYVIEAWVCRAGRLIFEPAGAFTTSARIVDEYGCAEPSHARLMAVEKHGFTLWIQIGWPPAVAP